METVVLLFIVLGLLSLTKFAFSFIYYFYAFFLRPAKPLSTHYGPWAVVTGPTDGIGKAIAFELARKGLNLILVGRSPTKLQNVSDSIKEKHPKMELKTVVFDLNGDINSGCAKLKEAISGLRVGVLVNNAGLAHPNSLYFADDQMDLYMEMITVNTLALTEITKVVLTGMLERRKGAIVNIGSGGSVVVPSYPLFAVYASTKAYVAQFSRSLDVEYKDKGIDVQCVAPGYVNTRMVHEAVRTWSNWLFNPSAERYAKATVRHIGYDPISVPFYPHFLQWCVSCRVPDWFNHYLRLKANIVQLKSQ